MLRFFQKKRSVSEIEQRRPDIKIFNRCRFNVRRHTKIARYCVFKLIGEVFGEKSFNAASESHGSSGQNTRISKRSTESRPHGKRARVTVKKVSGRIENADISGNRNSAVDGKPKKIGLFSNIFGNQKRRVFPGEQHEISFVSAGSVECSRCRIHQRREC